MPNLYGSGSTSSPTAAGRLVGLYGTPLSEDNAKQAQQLNIPGAIGEPQGPTGSQQQADDPFANFEDIFNKNRGDAAREAQAAQNSVYSAAGLKPTQTLPGASVANEPDPQAQTAQLARSAAPLQAQKAMTGPVSQIAAAPGLAAKQSVADGLLGSYGASPVAGGASVAKSSAPVIGGAAPVSQSYADTKTKGSRDGLSRPAQAPAAGVVAPTPPQQPQAASPVEQRAASPVEQHAPGLVKADGNQSYDPNAPNFVPTGFDPHARTAPGQSVPAKPALAPGDKEQAAGDAINPNPTAAELQKLDQLTNANDLLKGYGGFTDADGNQVAGDNGQSILQNIYGPEASQWDAAIMNQGGGREDFAALQKQLGGKDTEYAKQLATDVNARRQDQGADYTQASLIRAAHANDGAAPSAAAATPDAAAPKVATSSNQLDDLLYGGDDPGGTGETSSDKVLGEMHKFATEMSPADWATWGLGEAGIDSPMTSEAYVAAEGAAGGQTFQKAKIKMAFNQVKFEYGEEAATEFTSYLMNNPNVLNDYMQMHNPGFMARNMRMLLDSMGYVKVRNTGQAQLDSISGKSDTSDNVHSLNPSRWAASSTNTSPH